MTLYQQIDRVCTSNVARIDLADEIIAIVDRSDHMTLQGLDDLARAWEPVTYRGAQYRIKRLGYEYSDHDGDKTPYAELIDIKTGRCVVYAPVREIEWEAMTNV